MAVMESAIMTVLVLTGLLHSAAAVTYEVGASVGGWVILTTGQPDYDAQFANITLVPGDILLFPYVSGVHNVYEVTPANLATCTGTGAIREYTTTNTTITLTAGTHAYICEVPGHCNPGRMYLTVNVTSGAAVAPALAPSAAIPAPASGGPVPAPAPAPRSTPATPPPAPGPGVTPGSPGSPGSPALAPGEESPGSGAKMLLSGPAMLVASLLVGCVALLV